MLHPQIRTNKYCLAVDGMNSAWDQQDLQTCLAFFTNDIDFENSFGWTVRDRDELGGFLEWLFARYPKTDGKNSTEPKSTSEVDFLGPEIALVDSVKVIQPSAEGSSQRAFRTTYILKNEEGSWLIWKMRKLGAKFEQCRADRPRGTGPIY